VRIVGNGTNWGTRVIDTETGKDIPRVYRIEFDLDAHRWDKSARAIIHTYRVECDMETDAHIVEDDIVPGGTDNFALRGHVISMPEKEEPASA